MTLAKLPVRAKRTQRIGEAPNASIPMLAALAQRVARLAILERVASTPAYVAIANAAHSVNSYVETASVYADDCGEPGLSFYVYQSNLNRWTDPQYLDALALFGALAGSDYEVKENKDNLHRMHKWTWQFETGNPEVPTAYIRVQLDSYESKETAECRRVQVGTRTIEEPIYKYDCVAPEGNSGELPAPVLALDI